jgi:hypothetical protein
MRVVGCVSCRCGGVRVLGGAFESFIERVRWCDCEPEVEDIEREVMFALMDASRQRATEPVEPEETT